MKKIIEKIIAESKRVFQSGILLVLEPSDILYIVSTFNGYPTQENDGQLEELDLENFGILEVTDNKLRFWAGGDWQVPMEVTLELIEDKFVFTYAEKIVDVTGIENMHRNTIDEETVYDLFGLEIL